MQSNSGAAPAFSSPSSNKLQSEPTAAANVVQKIQYPLLPPIDESRDYTLVLDMDETLIHSYGDDMDKHYTRPGAH